MVPGERDDTLNFGFEKIHVDGRLLRPFDALLRVVADFSIGLGDKTVYREEEFCVVEFAAQLSRWLVSGLDQGAEFVYTSEESEVPGLVRLEHVGPDRWRLSVYDLCQSERRILETTVATEAVRSASRRFTARLYEQLPERSLVFRFLREEGATELLAFFGSKPVTTNQD